LKIAKLVPIFPALLLTACYSPPPPAAPRFQVIVSPRSIDAGQGIDLATDASDVLNELQDSRVAFVARYYRDPVSRWPALSASEAQRLSTLGLKIVAVWESHSRDPAHFSYAFGYSDAVTAYGEARAAGQPAGSAIYFAVDFNALWLEPIDEYFRGIAAGFAAASRGNAAYAIGVYGSGAVCDALRRTGLAQYSWLSNSIAWVGSTSYDGWNIRQGDRSPALSFNHDSDEARTEYGAFQLAAASHSGSPGNVIAQQSPQNGQSLAPTVAASH
jgi:hypothetical protein